MIRTDVVGALETALKKIKITNGYTTDLGNKVSVWNSVPLYSTTLPALVIMDTEVLYSERLGGGDYQKILITLEIVAQESTAVSAVRTYMADVYKCLDTEVVAIMYTYNLQDIYPESDQIMINEDFTKIAGARILIAAEYAGKKWGV